MRRWRYKSCPRCGGDLHNEVGQYMIGDFKDEDVEWVCLQCGYHMPSSKEETCSDVREQPVTVNSVDVTQG